MQTAGKTRVGYARNYQTFWPYFMECHEHSATQWIHVAATVIGLFCMLIMFPLTLNGAWLAMGPALAYPIAWFSHLAFEKKKPAAWRHPYWSFLCDLDMMVMKLSGTLEPDLERLGADPGRPFTLRRRILHHATELAVLACALAVAALWLRGSITFSIPLGR